MEAMLTYKTGYSIPSLGMALHRTQQVLSILFNSVFTIMGHTIVTIDVEFIDALTIIPATE
jgi:hypothetical protein